MNRSSVKGKTVSYAIFFDCGLVERPRTGPGMQGPKEKEEKNTEICAHPSVSSLRVVVSMTSMTFTWSRFLVRQVRTLPSTSTSLSSTIQLSARCMSPLGNQAGSAPLLRISRVVRKVPSGVIVRESTSAETTCEA
jgi:hypothetical protein